jgi:hypothetical protein
MYYKYLPRERITYFKDELLRFTQPGDLNDPFECRPQVPKFEDFEDTLNDLGKMFNKNGKSAEEFVKNSFTSQWLENQFKEAYHKTNNEIGIFSLSRNWNNSLMWSHYTISHKGFCVGFNENYNFFKNYLSIDRNTSRYTLDVVYSEKRVRIPTQLSEPRLLFEPQTTKSIDWRYEDEVRVIATLNSASESIKSNPFEIFLFKVPHDAISEIIMGVNMSDDDEETIKKFAKENQIKIFKAQISDTEFDMIR